MPPRKTSRTKTTKKKEEQIQEVPTSEVVEVQDTAGEAATLTVAEDVEPPAPEQSVAVDVPAEAEATPAETEATPAETEATPAETEATPAETEATPAEAEATPAETEATPAEAAPAEAAPAEAEAAPAEAEIQLVEEAPSIPSFSISADEVFSLLSQDDLYFFNEGSHYRLHEKLGSKIVILNGVEGTNFAVWAPDAIHVSVIGEFNSWDPETNKLHVRGDSGIWEGFIPGVGKGDAYKYHIISRFNNYRIDKTDPFAFHNEVPSRTGSIVWDLDYAWNDKEWMETRREKNSLDAPISIYEVHPGSWMRVPEDENRFLSYRELAEKLTPYVKKMGFTHVEFMPIMEHPFYGSWGYQVTGFFAPTSRYGTPQDLMFLIDTLHQNGIGVILDWVPSHFPTDGHGLGYFDGTHLFEHSYPQKGWHPDWQSFIFNYGRHEVRSFLLSIAIYWLDKYHIDGLRVDAVASMLYLDYSRKEGEWMPNQYGGKENIEAIDFLRRFNKEIFENFPDTQTIAEESTDWSMVSRPTYVGGLGFGLKWDMGWMHDTLTYITRDPIYRKYHHNELTFRMLYAFTENFALPLSHDEVVHGKGSLLSKMPGDLWQKFANLRLLFGYMYMQPGKKLLFVGGEIGQWREWYHEESLDWRLLQFAPHSGLQKWVTDLNTFYRDEPAMHELDLDPQGFRWVDCNDWESSTLSLLRRGKITDTTVLAKCNFTPVPRKNYRVGVPFGGFWREVLNSDAREYEGSGQGNMGGVEAEELSVHGLPFSLTLNVPPLGIVFFTGIGPTDW